jgi:hypothetical protein
LPKDSIPRFLFEHFLVSEQFLLLSPPSFLRTLLFLPLQGFFLPLLLLSSHRFFGTMRVLFKFDLSDLPYLLNYLPYWNVEKFPLFVRASVTEPFVKNPLDPVMVVHEGVILNFEWLWHSSPVKFDFPKLVGVSIAFSDLYTTRYKGRIGHDVNETGHVPFRCSHLPEPSPYTA